MKRITALLIVIAVSILSFSCSADTQSQLLGTWESDQASQAVGSDEEMAHYNYLEIEEGIIRMGNHIYETKVGVTIKRVTEANKKVKYQWRSKTEISINNVRNDY